jgi:hypothetical protein
MPRVAKGGAFSPVKAIRDLACKVSIKQQKNAAG